MAEVITICEDAGHYGKYNRCPNNPNYYESKVMWDLHLLEKKYLEQLGIKVILTREDQEKDLPLRERGKASEGCHLFISDHTNAVASGMNEKIDYVVIYYLVNDDSTDADDISKEIAEKLAATIADVMKPKQGYRIETRKASSDKNGDGKMNDNYYGVLNGARIVNTPGMIVEHSFHTNTAMVNWLLNKDNLDKLARAKAEVIAEYFLKKDVSLEDKPVSTPSSGTANTLYRVQTGAFKVKANAEEEMAKVKKAGFAAFVTQVDGWYKVQVGAYSVRANADATLDKIQKAGFKAFITTKGGDAVPAKKTEKEVATEIYKGLGNWGTGEARKKKLEAAGYNYKAVQALVNEMFK